MRIIDADKVLLSILKTQQEYEGMSRLVEDTDPYFLGAIIGLKNAAFEILSAIEVDAEVVVRCKDCKFSSEEYDRAIWCDRQHDEYPTNHFCGYGERREKDG